MHACAQMWDGLAARLRETLDGLPVRPTWGQLPAAFFIRKPGGGPRRLTGDKVVEANFQGLQVAIEPFGKGLEAGEGRRRNGDWARRGHIHCDRLSRVSGMSISAAFHGSHPFVLSGRTHS